MCQLVPAGHHVYGQLTQLAMMTGNKRRGDHLRRDKRRHSVGHRVNEIAARRSPPTQIMTFGPPQKTTATFILLSLLAAGCVSSFPTTVRSRYDFYDV